MLRGGVLAIFNCDIDLPALSWLTSAFYIYVDRKSPLGFP
jgi:hypothetical protein